jgi:hypothetical protein
MRIARGKLRSVQDIRTMSGKVDRTSIPHMAYMRVTMLEMEKTRLDEEKQSALARIQIIVTRLGELEQEKDELLRALGERNGGGNHGAHSHEPDVDQRRTADGFRLRY